MSSETMISVNELSKCYMMYDKPEYRLWQMLWRTRKAWSRDFWALRDITFDVRKGETVAVIGRNGSGKSTLLQLICNTLEPTRGNVQVGGKIAALLELGAGFNAEFTGRENIYLNGAILGMEKSEMDARFQSIIDFADIGDFLNQPVKTYSSGMYVRLAFAVAIHCQPEVLIIDEALAVGDFLFQQKCSRFMKEQFSDVTKLLVTHDMAAVANMADRAIVLHQGKLIYDGDPQSAIREYQIVARGGKHVTHIASDKHADNSEKSNEDILKAYAERDWITINEHTLSGSLRARIRKCAYEVDGVSGVGAIGSGQQLVIDFEASIEGHLDQVIVGYQVQDRFGSVIFGENSMSSDFSLPNLDAGTWRFSLMFDWPIVAPGKYAVTLGIGSGYDALSHSIECWAHNVIILDSSSDVDVHGLFNVEISQLTVKESSQ
ncbi:ABC transporter ATP-binding protein [Ahrensia marina]|uniref:ABC transporter domain-containing protein n=1 Tax=Ahrensia marina TaxID=1514904 RepID=A0A0M9GMG3_9HYPH|nr:ABC transporter ATP-binding protein [Ahrensia marina]KPB01220.1 hypothetical protein SU32_10090 [Ahrensia marina]